MKSIQNLIRDVYATLDTPWFTPEHGKELGDEVSQRLEAQYKRRTQAPTLRLSKMGPICPCALWASIHAPGEAEALPPWANFKFSYGHIIEATAIVLAKAAGHSVLGEQDAVSVDGITGHRDCVLDGHIVDVKSCSSRAFDKFKDQGIAQADSFGYLDQLDGYMVGSLEDDLVLVKDRAYIWAIDKTLGRMCLYEHKLREDSIRRRIAEHKRIVALPKAPRCECGTVPDGKSGNIKLDMRASYSAFKHYCFPELRTFIYANGPVYLTTVARKPDVLEVDRYGKPIYSR